VLCSGCVIVLFSCCSVVLFSTLFFDFFVLIFFFFQAEDGIRDATVTGVQTCALPILAPWSRNGRRTKPSVAPTSRMIAISRLRRSEERRVGKECRSRWSPYH